MKAFYDNQPSKFEAVGNGSYVYRWNIEETAVAVKQSGSPEDEPRKQYSCNEAIVWGTVTSNKITQAVVAELMDSDHEQKLINEYNSAVLGILPEGEAAAKVAAYKAFLEQRAAVKAQVDADCAELGIR